MFPQKLIALLSAFMALCASAASLQSFAASNEPELYENSIFAPTSEEVAETDDGLRYVSGTLMVLFDAGTSEEQMRTITEAQGGEAIGYNSALDMMQVRVSGNSYEQLRRVAQRYNALQGVQFATPTVFADVSSVPNDPWEGDLSDSSWTGNLYRDSNWNMDLINAPEAWDMLDNGISVGASQPIRVGVIDNELDVDHPEFTQPDDDLVVRCMDDERPDRIGNARSIHGSHVAGIMAAAPNNGQYITGIFQSGEVLFSQADGDIASLLVKLERMVNAGTKVINFSWGLENGTASQAEEFAVPFALAMKKLFDSGFDDFLVVQSAGNNGHDASLNSLFATINTSARFQAITGCSELELQKMMDRIVVVAAVERPDKAGGRLEYCIFSNNGPRVDVAAPGGYIVSTAPLYLSGSNGLIVMSGTSMSAAHVSGVIGLVWSANPELTAPLVKEYLCANPLRANGLGDDLGAPLLDAEFSVRLALNTHIVRFDPNGGSVSPTSIIVTNGETYSAMPTPTRANYTFDGWYTASSGGAKVSPTDTVNLNGNTTLYAQWTANSQPPPAKGIFGTNAKWYGAWWHYLLFFFCFGFIWMWF